MPFSQEAFQAIVRIERALREQSERHDRQHVELRDWLSGLDEKVERNSVRIGELCEERAERVGAEKARKPIVAAMWAGVTAAVVAVAAQLVELLKGSGK